MKAVFLAQSVTTANGKSAISLVDVSAGEGLEDFKAGTPDGKIRINLFGDNEDFTPGSSWLVTMEPYNPDATAAAPVVDAAAPVTETAAEPAALAADPTPVTKEMPLNFTAIVTTLAGEVVSVGLKLIEGEVDKLAGGDATDKEATPDTQA